LEIISQAFEGKNPVQRHRMVYGLLQEELDNGVHALALKTKTPAEAGKQ
jgi:BolA protein